MGGIRTIPPYPAYFIVLSIKHMKYFRNIRCYHHETFGSGALFVLANILILFCLPSCMSPFFFYWSCSQPSIVFNSNGIKYWVGHIHCYCDKLGSGWCCLFSPWKVDFSHPDFTSVSKVALTELSFPPPQQSLLHTYICVCFFVLFCPPAHLCLCQEMFCKQLEVWRSIEESENH